MRRKFLQWAGIGSLALLVAVVSVAQSDARTLRLNESLPPGSIEGEALRKFKQIVEQRSGGELEISLHFQDELGGPQTSMENLGTGTLELYSGALSYYAALIPKELGVTTVLYLFEDSDHLRRYLTGPVHAKGMETLRNDFGIRFISTKFLGDRGPYRIWVSTKPVMAPDDLKGVKMRLWPNDMAIRAWKHLGAVPSVIPWTETYLAIRQGVVSAVTSGVNGIHDQKFTEVAPYITEFRQFPQIWPITVSEKVWQSLTPQQRQILVDAANEATGFYGEQSNALAESNIQNMIKTNNAVYIRINTDPFVEKMQSFYQDLIGEGALDKEVYDEVMRLR